MKLNEAILIKLNALYILKEFLAQSENKINAFDVCILVDDQKTSYFDDEWGICGNLNEIIENLYGYIIREKVQNKLTSHIYKINSKWKHFSGDEDYPIRPSKGYAGDASEYYTYIPKYVGRQLKKRRQLVEHQIKGLQNMLYKKYEKYD